MGRCRNAIDVRSAVDMKFDQQSTRDMSQVVQWNCAVTVDVDRETRLQC